MRLWRYNRSLETLGQRYHLRGSLGSGGMADVCLAWDEREQREVAIKVIRPDELDQRALDRFMKEAAKIARWQHPHILRVYSDLMLELVDPARGSMVPYIVMEYAAGGDLQKRLRPGQPFPLKGILTLFPQLCSAVAYAHEHGVIHRDLKPLNILFRVLPDASEQVVLSDFGLAVEISATHHTYAGGGTLPYMAPEQFRGAAIPESDIFALGVILYQLCTGRLPFRRTLLDVGRDLAHNQALPPPPAPSSIQPLLPPDLDAVILRALAHDPHQRYQHAEDLWRDTHAALLEPSGTNSVFTVSHQSLAESPSSAERHSGDIRSDDFTPDPDSLSSLSGDDDEALTSLPNADDLVPELQNGFSTQRLPSHPNSFSRSITPAPEVAQEQDDLAPISRSITHPRRSRTNPHIRSIRSITPSRRVSPNPNAQSTTPPQRAHSNPDLESIIPPRRSRSNPDSLSITPSRRSRPGSFSEASTSPRRTRGDTHPHPIVPHTTTRKRRPAYPYILLAALLILALLGTAIFALPGLRGLTAPLTSIFGGGRATITITAFSHLKKNSYTVDGVANNPDPAHMQIKTRQVTATTQSNTQTIIGTGKKQTPGTRATGILTFLNGSGNPFSIASGTQIKANNGAIFVTDTIANIPAADTNTAQVGSITITAHAAEIGKNGNIEPLAISHTCCNEDFIYVKNTSPFTGGSDPQNYTFVTQQDVDQGIGDLKTQTTTQSSKRLSQQLQEGEEMADEPQCDSKLNANPAIGDHGTNVTSSQVSVRVTCRAHTYNKQELQSLLAPKLQQQASADLGPSYSLQGPITTHFTQQKQASDHITWTVEASGTWVYTWNDAARQNLVRHIAGQTVTQARAWLRSQPGIASLDINYPGDHLPNDPGQITITIKT